jgi:methionine biosynthesis protein MetW
MNVRLDGANPEHRLILDLVRPGSSILDLGCGDGDLLSLLVLEKKARAQGLELDEQAIYKCVARGLSVFHGDIDTGLSEYGDRSFDYVIFDQSLQQVRHPGPALTEALRVGREVIVAFPNFAYWPARTRMFFSGRTPVTRALPYEWHDSPNLHFLGIADFQDYCRDHRISIRDQVYLRNAGITRVLPNLLAEIGIFLIAEGR